MTGSLFDSNPSAPSSNPLLTAHCDGGARGNPGPAGFGAVIEDATGRTVARLSHFLGIQTNNYAEYSGLLAVLKWTLDNGHRHLRVVSDSELMVKQMQGKYKVSSPSLRPLWEEARALARKLDKFEITHTLRGGNKEADRLANEAMDKGMGKPPNAARPYPNAPKPQPEQVLEGYVKNGVIHLLNGELPEGVFVKITRS